ncbi:MAG TPA: type I polyketide synthase, partial [Streptosporangiaceae bacterium]
MAPDPVAFWELLSRGVSAISEMPDDRWGGLREAANGEAEGIRQGGFLGETDRFDPAFFGISPREAVEMDPQQRLMLELSWEALEDAAIIPAELGGSRAGVFIGCIWDDYANMIYRRGANAMTQHTLPGINRGVIANRVSYTLGLRGPSITVDSAQSSALVAVHLACESLRRGETTLALAGGVNLILAPESAAGSVRFGALSPDGRCFTFDARANGYVRGEGAGLVVLKPLPQAIADGDCVYCVILGSAVNNDGASSGLTVPSVSAQAEVLRQAYIRAGIEPGDAQYVELHGTGTKVGDPIEAAALGQVLGTARMADDPVLVGSVKTNIGHLEGAAGIAGLLKVALSIKYRQIPPSLNFESPNPRIDLNALKLRVPVSPEPWPNPTRRLVAGVSSFGMGGTNCHMVLAASPALSDGRRSPELPLAGGPGPVVPWIVTARDETTLSAQAKRLYEHLENHADLSPAEVGWSLATTRTAFEHRAVILGHDRDTLLTGLDALARGAQAAGLVRGRADGTGKLAVLFTGQGSQNPGIGRKLYAACPPFAAALDAACQHLDAHLDRPLRDVMFANGTAEVELLDETRYTQPALFALETALFRLFEHWGLQPDFVLGHSVGELAAAHAAGVLSLEDACTLVAARGRLMQDLPAGGAMISVAAAEEEVLESLAGLEEQVAIAAINGPRSVVISGDEDAAAELAALWVTRGRKVKRLRVSHAFHSPRMDPMLAAFEEIARELSYSAPQIQFVSTVTGQLADGDTLRTARYWCQNVRRPVRFYDGIRSLRSQGASAYLELGPGGTLIGMADDCLGDAAALLMPVLGSGPGKAKAADPAADTTTEPKAALVALAGAYTHGFPVQWNAVFPARGRQRVALPTYAFHRQRYWPDVPSAGLILGTTPAVEAEPAPDAEPAHTLAARLAGVPEAEHEKALLDLVRSNVATILGHATPEAVDSHRTFKELGFDSASAVEFRSRLNAATGLRLPSALTFNYPTPAALAEFLRAEAEAGLSSVTAPDPQATRASVPAVAAADDELIAIVGMACRFPGGVGSPEQLWRLVCDGKDAIGEFPSNRGWDTDGLYDPDPESPATSYVRTGGFLYDADRFDAAFFGISPREALAMDPQQRLLLETAWEAFERAKIDPAALRGSMTGVFMGAMAQDYGPRLSEATEGMGGYVLTGNSASVVSGRVAYAFGLEGPAVTVDTACSSSLTALHLAGQALRRGECSLALAGGVTIMASPGMFVEFSRQRGLAPDGKCKAFAAAADGTAWSEGVGVIVVELLADARRNGHQVLAVIRGSAINQDGASNGLTAPNGLSQQRVVRQALADARLTPAQVDAVEAHGTGTTLGDPIEAEALIATYGQDRPSDQPLWLGSLKSNIGHSQAAAGVGGVIKMVMAIRHGILPRTLHVDKPTPHVDWSSGAVSLLTQARPWPGNSRPRRAGISSFGISGTNAHLILEQAPADEAADAESPADPAVPAGSPLAWLVSAKSEQALREQAGRLRDLITADDRTDLINVGSSLAATRSRFSHRAVIVGESRDEFLRGLEALVHAGSAPGLVRGVASGTGKTVFVFPGQGSQWRGMALELLDSSPLFREQVMACADAMEPFTDWSLMRVLREDDSAPAADRVDVIQPALFAMMVSLAGLWRSLGLEPDAVVGHSQGEIAAAYIAGALSLDDAARIVTLRSQALVTLAGRGGLASVPLPPAGVETDLARWAGRLEIATINGPSSTVVSGDTAALDELLAAYAASGVRARRIKVDYASHSRHVEAIREHLIGALSGIAPRTSETAFYSTVTGGRLDTAALDADYWYRNLRHIVQFERATRALLSDGHRGFVEVSPHPVLTVGIQDTLDDLETADAAPEAVVVGSLRRGDGGWRRLLTSAAEAYVRGVPVDLKAPPAAEGGRHVPLDLPTYAFQRERYWLNKPTAAAAAADLGLSAADHPLLSATVELADGDRLVLTGRVSRQAHQWLADHTIVGTILMPGTAFAELALHAGRHARCNLLDELILETPLALPASGGVQVQVSVGPADESGHRSIAIHSRPETAGERNWTCHATGRLAVGTLTGRQKVLEEWPPTEAVQVPVDELYDRLASQGYEYGPAFRCLRAAWRHGDDVLAEVSLAEDAQPDAGLFGIHPALFDSALQVLGVSGLLGADGEGHMRLPFSWDRVSLYSTGTTAARVRCRPAGSDAVEVTIADALGDLVATVRSVAFRPVPPERIAAAVADPDCLYQLSWPALPPPPAPHPPCHALTAAPDGLPATATWPAPADLAAAIAA